MLCVDYTIFAIHFDTTPTFNVWTQWSGDAGNKTVMCTDKCENTTVKVLKSKTGSFDAPYFVSVSICRSESIEKGFSLCPVHSKVLTLQQLAKAACFLFNSLFFSLLLLCSSSPS